MVLKFHLTKKIIMKKILLAVIILVGLSTTLSAQAKFGLKGGISIANAKMVSGNVTTTYNSIVSPQFGVTVDFKGSDKFNVQSGLLYNGFGGKSSESSETNTTTIGALSVPVLAKFQLGSGFYGYAGPQISFVLSAKDKWAYGSTSGEEDMKDQVKSTLFHGVLGLGYKIQDHFGVFGEYQAGLSNVDNSTENSGNTKINVHALTFGLSYTF